MKIQMYKYTNANTNIQIHIQKSKSKYKGKYGEEAWDNVRKMANIDTPTFSIHQVIFNSIRSYDDYDGGYDDIIMVLMML